MEGKWIPDDRLIPTTEGPKPVSEVSDVHDELDVNGRRQYRANTEPMVVVPVLDAESRTATGEYDVYNIASVSRQQVVLPPGSADNRDPCNCLDHLQRGPTNGCKHFRRVGLAMWEGNVPAIEEPLLDSHVEYLRTRVTRSDIDACEDDDRRAMLKALQTDIESTLLHG